MAEISLMLSLPGRPQELDGLARKAITLAGDEFRDHSTTVHDAIFGRGKISLEEALDIEPKSVDTLDAAGLSPLHWAVHRNDIAAVQTLLAWKASVDLLSRGEKRTALHIAARAGHTACARMLLDTGADINYRDVYQRTALCLAALSGAVELVSLLLSRGADVHAQEMDGEVAGATILQRAIEPDTHPKDDAALELIIQQLAQFGIDLDRAGKSGETPIMTAIRYNSPAAFRALVSGGAQLTKKDSKGRTVFHYAASFADIPMIRALEEADLSMVDPDAHDRTGQTAVTVLEQKGERQEDVEKGTASYSRRTMIAAARLRHSQRLSR
jgi:ankyrin repeat protein